LLAFASDFGAFAALGGQDVRVPGAGVAPAQVSLELASEHGVVGVAGVAHDEGAQWPELGSIGLAHEALVGVRHSSTLFFLAQARIVGVLFADRLSMIT
jgi:hypothetical protein